MTVAKTFIFSLFTHILNTMYITNNQLEIIQKILNEFLWRGWNKIKPSVIMSPEIHGGLNMIHVKNAVHCLWVKWMNHMCHDVSSSWSQYIWWKIEDIIPFDLIGSVHAINENLLQGLPPFYASMLRSYAMVNNLFYEQNQELELPYNLWYSTVFPFLDKKWCLAGVNNVLDLPITNNQISIGDVTHMVGQAPNVYLRCCTLQGTLMKYRCFLVVGTNLPHPSLLLQMKSLLKKQYSCMLTLARWEEFLGILPMKE